MKKIVKNSIKYILFKIIQYYSISFNKRIEQQYLINEKEIYPLQIINNNLDDSRFNESTARYKSHLHKEWIFDIKEPCIIEPEYGIVFSPSCKFLYRSFNYHVLITYKNFPYKSFFKILFRKVNETINEAFSLRDLNESNYWHFFDDEMSKLRLFETTSVNIDAPILVGKNLWETHFFQYAVKNTGFKSFNWKLHKDICKVNRLIIAVPASLQAENFYFFLEKSGINLNPTNLTYVFVNRSLTRGRTIRNLEEITSVLNKYSISVVENDGLSFVDQLLIYKNAQILIGIHGAGLVNLIYRIGKPTGLFEIFHPKTINPHYVWMSKTFHFKYDFMVGNDEDTNGNFYIDPVIFERKVKSFINCFRKKESIF